MSVEPKLSQSYVNFKQEFYENFKELFSSFNFFILDKDLKFFYVNKKFKSLIKVPILHKPIENFLGEEEQVLIEILKSLKENDKLIKEIRFNIDNQIFLLKVAIFKNQKNQILCVGLEINENEFIDLEYIHRNELFEIIKLSLECGDLKSFLDKLLLHLTKIPWLSLQSEAGFMLNVEEELRLISYYNVSDSLVKMCARVPFGRCLCGKAAETKEIIYKAHVDQDHENRPEGIKPHGHYNVPILHGEQLLGVLFLYIEDGYPKKQEELEFLKKLSPILAMIILRYQADKEYQEAIAKLIRMNEIMVENLKKIHLLEEFIDTYVPDVIKKDSLNKKNKTVNFYIENNYYLLINFHGLIQFSNTFPLQKVYETIEQYYNPIIDCIVEHKGDVEQYLEDRIFAIFSDSSEIVNCSLKIKEIIHRINEKRKAFYLKPFHFQIAINYGTTFFGIIGSQKRKNWMRFGDTIRWLTSMQKKCEQDQIIVSEFIYMKEKENHQFSKPFKIIKEKNSSQYLIARYLLS